MISRNFGNLPPFQPEYYQIVTRYSKLEIRFSIGESIRVLRGIQEVKIIQNLLDCK